MIAAKGNYFPLKVSLTHSRIRSYYKPQKKIKAHDLVVRPLLQNSLEAFVYGIKKENKLYKSNADILLFDKGKFRFDVSKECIKGHEFLWNIGGWERGSIVMILPEFSVDFKSIFKNCYRPGLSLTPNMGNSPSATLMCKKARKAGKIAVCFPASNGLEWMSIYASQELTNKLEKIAKKYCKERDYLEREEARLG